MDVTVVIGTYGEAQWQMLAERRAIPSAHDQGVDVVAVHSEHSLHDARNRGLAEVHTEWVCFLDADDQLEAGFFERIAAAEPADLIAPAIRYVRHHWSGGPPQMPRVAGHQHTCEADCLLDGNWLVIGTVARADVVRHAGGFRDWPMFEDWDLWLRCRLNGATVSSAPKAVYKAWMRRGSRNRSHKPDECLRVHNDILTSVGLAPLAVP